MTKKKFAIIISSLAIVTVAALTFLYFSNDHAECEVQVEQITTSTGKTITTEKHICKERFAL